MALARKWSMNRDCLPAVFPHSACAEHGVVLALLFRFSIWGRIETVSHRDAGKRKLLDSIELLWHLHTANVEDGRHEVCRVVILVAHFPFGFDAFRPVDDHRVAGAARVV